MKKNIFFIIALPCIALALGVISWKIITAPKPISPPPTPEFHIHADFKVFINNQPIDFSLEKYQSHTTGTKHDDFTHLHDGNGDVLHIHKAGITLGYFFKTLGMQFTKECFVLDTGEKFCNTDNYQLQLFVNGQPSEALDDYIPQDLDKILITYDDLLQAESHIPQQMSAVTDKACIYSKKCPERGSPPVESCVVGQPCMK